MREMQIAAVLTILFMKFGKKGQIGTKRKTNGQEFIPKYGLLPYSRIEIRLGGSFAQIIVFFIKK